MKMHKKLTSKFRASETGRNLFLLHRFILFNVQFRPPLAETCNARLCSTWDVFVTDADGPNGRYCDDKRRQCNSERGNADHL